MNLRDNLKTKARPGKAGPAPLGSPSTESDHASGIVACQHLGLLFQHFVDLIISKARTSFSLCVVLPTDDSRLH